MDIAADIKNRLSPLFREPDLRLAVLFGSAATERIHKRSDIDLAFLFDKPVDIVDLTNKVIRLLRTDSVDVVDLKKANPLLKFSVVKQGKLLYEKEPGDFNTFSSLAFRMYVDTKKLRDAQEACIRSFLHEKGLA